MIAIHTNTDTHAHTAHSTSLYLRSRRVLSRVRVREAAGPSSCRPSSLAYRSYSRRAVGLIPGMEGGAAATLPAIERTCVRLQLYSQTLITWTSVLTNQLDVCSHFLISFSWTHCSYRVVLHSHLLFAINF